MQWVLNRIAAALRRKLSQQRITAALKKLPQRPSMGKIPGDPKAAALQVTACAYLTVDAWVEDIDTYIHLAVQQGAQLVCFPELFGLLPLTLSPLVRMALRFLPQPGAAASSDVALPSKTQTGLPKNLSLDEVLQTFDFVAARYQEVFGWMAKRYGIWLSAGTTFMAESGKIYNRHQLYAPTGQLAGQQDKLHLVQEEMAMGIATGDSLTVVETPLGNMALTVCMDATYFETFRVAKALGADYAIVPIGNMEPYHDWLALRGAQSRVNETGLAAIKAALVDAEEKGTSGDKKRGLRLGFSGRAGIYFPIASGCESVEYIAESDKPFVCAKLDLLALRGAKSEVFCLENKAFDEIYVQAITGIQK
jgi:predicted amidohydrolase